MSSYQVIDDDRLGQQEDDYTHHQALPAAQEQPLQPQVHFQPPQHQLVDTSGAYPPQYQGSQEQQEATAPPAHQRQFGPGDHSHHIKEFKEPNYDQLTDDEKAALDLQRQQELVYPSWIENVEITQTEIKHVFNDLQKKFGFQKSSMDNMIDHLLIQLDSRASRFTPVNALTSLHASYIGGENSNYRKWFFAAQLDLDEEIGFSNMNLHGKSNKRNKKIAKKKKIDIREQQRLARERENEYIDKHMKVEYTPEELERSFDFKIADYKWKQKMRSLTPKQKIEQIALYLLIWGEANQLRFVPECLCFIYKTAYDYLLSDDCSKAKDGLPEFHFLNNVINPLYKFIRDQTYIIDNENGGRLLKREKDHKDIIGYDDINQLFWYPEGIERLKLKESNERLVDVELAKRYLKFNQINWEKAFYKTYKERRTWLHAATNFNRIWIIHLSSFWFFTSFNSPTLYTANYSQLLDNQPTPQSRFSAIALGGFVACLIQLVATLSEWCFVPREWPGAQHLTKRLLGLIGISILNLAPSIYIFGFFGLETVSKSAYILSIIQFVIAIITVMFFSFRPLGSLFGGNYLNYSKRNSIKNESKFKFRRRYVSSRTFTASFPKLTGKNRWFSIILWITIFSAKFLESYFFLTLSIRDPIRVLSIMDMTRCVGDSLLGNILCRQQARITLGLIYFTDLILFFLDTYLWYIVCNCIFSVGLSFILGISILTPWRNVYTRLPKRIYSKILATTEMDVKYKPKILVSQVWNAIIISMYREHLIPIDTVHKLLYQQIASEVDGKKTLKPPSFFISRDDSNSLSIDKIFEKNHEAERRISFFAQSLSTPIPEPIAIESMPTFTVLVPHYSEKIILSLKECIKENDPNSRITLLEYLKQLYPTEWECFVRDSKLLAMDSGILDPHNKFDISKRVISEASFNDELREQEKKLKEERHKLREQKRLERLEHNSGIDTGNLIYDDDEEEDSPPPTAPSNIIPNSPEDDFIQSKINDLPFYCIGYKNSSPEYILRTRIWASLRTQTLYRTASGFTNYTRALKLLYRIENPEMVQYYAEDPESLEMELEAMSHRKFKLILAMQRLEKFNEDEEEDCEFLLTAYPNTKISYIHEEINEENPNGEKIYYSCLIDGFSKIGSNGKRIPYYKIRLSGNPILGDGKSDNQNHSLIFYRGEYIQVIDANQDNYLEECIKIRSILAEFEELDSDFTPPYIPGVVYKDEAAPVAIIGAREYIFSENIGVLGDVAAGKEQTFGTLFARTLAEIGGKLHYGHPDFLNAIFMTTRGGISKAQKGLHLNEDIYAGMNAMLRGGRIKHCDYYQCGKGRDLGFGSILNFTTKIGAGMGEQILSREYYYLGTQLPLDRFLSFYYAHAGFHINNLFITLSVQLFMIVLVNLGALANESIICDYDKDVPFTDIQRPIGCYNLQPVLDWVTIFVLSVFIVFFISFVPLIVQELTERGLWKATSRFFRHLSSLSPIFEVFVCQIYANALLTDVTFGGAKYISTGRGFAVSRIQFFYLYSKFTSSSIYQGSKLFLMLLFATITIWQPALLWFWLTLVAMCVAPFMFNPHQFSFQDFFIDYRDFIHWISRGNSKWHANSWIGYIRQSRARFTGYKKKLIDHESEKAQGLDIKKSHFKNTYFTELILPFFSLLFLFSAYSFINSQNGVKKVKPTNGLLRLVILTFAPMVIDGIILVIFFGISCITGPLFLCCCASKNASTISAVTHGCSITLHILLFEVMWFLESWDFSKTLILLLTVISFQDFIFKLITILLLSREYKNDKSNRSWWSGNWYKSKVGWRVILQPSREFIVKIMEMSLFSADFILGHSILFIQTPLVLIPYIDTWHTMILFWLLPKHQFKTRIISKRKQRRRRLIVIKYAILYFFLLSIFLILIILPAVNKKVLIRIRDEHININHVYGLIQPTNQTNDDTGTNAPASIPLDTPTFRPVFKTAPY